MTRAYFALILAISLSAVGDQNPCPQPGWAMDLVLKYQFQDFGPKKNPANQPALPWTNQQGIEFISPEVLAVYQASEVDDPQPVSPKDASGGSGRYQLHVLFLDVKQGSELKSFHLVTSGWLQSRVFATHDGRFLVRTGETIRSFSAGFEQLAIAHFPYSNQQQYEVIVSFSGERIYVRYYTAFKSSNLVLDADSLHVVKDSPQDDVSPGQRTHGFTFVPKDLSCRFGFTGITSDVSVGFGCKELKVFSFEGQLLWDIPMDRQVASVQASGVYLAALIEGHYVNLLHSDIGPEPLRIELYDVNAKSEKCSIAVNSKPVSGQWPPILYAVSTTGEVAVIHGNILSVYRP
jgi:hypothetical protein